MTKAKIDINQADVQTLAALPGIGAEKAKRIVQHRETKEPFTDIMSLTAVSGISERMVRQCEDQITVEATMPASSQLRVIETDDETAVAPSESHALDEAADPDVEETDPLLLTPPVAAADEVDDNETEFEPWVAGTAATDSAEEAEAEPATDSPEEDSDDEDTSVSFAPVVTAVSQDSPNESEPEDMPEDEPATDDSSEDDTATKPLLITPPPFSPAADSQPTPPAMADAVEDPQQVQQAAIWGAIGGALGGILLTLLILFLINGSLSYAAESRALQQELIEAQATQAAFDRELTDMAAALGGDIGSLSQRLDTADSRLDETNNNITSLGSDVSQAQTDIGTLYDTSQALDERLVNVAAAADTFNTFLDGLRDLLFDLQGPPAAITPTTSITTTSPITPTLPITPTPDMETDEDMDTDADVDETENDEAAEEDEADETNDSLPTRTPRPTATPIGAPTVTPTP